MLTPRVSKLILTAHITFSVAWFGAVAAFLALAINRSKKQRCSDGAVYVFSDATGHIIRDRPVRIGFAADWTSCVSRHEMGLVSILLGYHKTCDNGPNHRSFIDPHETHQFGSQRRGPDCIVRIGSPQGAGRIGSEGWARPPAATRDNSARRLQTMRTNRVRTPQTSKGCSELCGK